MDRLPGAAAVRGLLRQAATASVVVARSGAGLVVEVRETVRAAHRVALRADAVTAELEEPLRALAPSLRRLAAALDDPVVEGLPGTVRRLEEDVLPVLRTLADTHERVAALSDLSGQTERVLAFVDEASRSLGGLGGSLLLGRRRPGSPPGPGRVVPGEVVDPPES